jgi:hypothetical protein
MGSETVGPNLRYSPGACQERLRKTNHNLSPNIRDEILTSDGPKYETGLLLI